MRVHRPLLICVLLALAASGLLPAAAADAEADGFATPEAAITEYLAGIAALDTERIVGATSAELASTRYRFDALIDRIGAFTPISMLAPAEHPFYAEINLARERDAALRNVLMLAYGLLSSEEIDSGVIFPVDKAWADLFAFIIDPTRLADIELVAIKLADEELQADSRYLENAAKQAAGFGADELTERLALFEFEGELFELGFTLLRYGDDWRVMRQSSPLAGTEPIGTARLTTLEEFESGASDS